MSAAAFENFELDVVAPVLSGFGCSCSHLKK